MAGIKTGHKKGFEIMKKHWIQSKGKNNTWNDECWAHDKETMLKQLKVNRWLSPDLDWRLITRTEEHRCIEEDY